MALGTIDIVVVIIIGFAFLGLPYILWIALGIFGGFVTFFIGAALADISDTIDPPNMQRSCPNCKQPALGRPFDWMPDDETKRGYYDWTREID